jgi:hypothetical protein
MALNRPFTYAVQIITPASSIATGSILVGVGEQFDLYRILADATSQYLFVVGLRDSTGLQYVVASTSQPIATNLIFSPTRPSDTNVFEFVKPISLIGQVQFLIDLQNTYTNPITINLALVGYKTVGGGG